MRNFKVFEHKKVGNFEEKARDLILKQKKGPKMRSTDFVSFRRKMQLSLHGKSYFASFSGHSMVPFHISISAKNLERQLENQP